MTLKDRHINISQLGIDHILCAQSMVCMLISTNENKAEDMSQGGGCQAGQQLYL